MGAPRGYTWEWVIKEFGAAPVLRERTLTLTTAGDTILDNNTNRVQWAISNVDVNIFTAQWGRLNVGGAGIPINGNGGIIAQNVRDDFLWPTFAVFGFSTSGPTELYIVELIVEATPKVEV